MKILKEGEVIFRNGEIKEINNFTVEGDTFGTLTDYVKTHYFFKKEEGVIDNIIKCSWCDKEAKYQGFNLNKIPINAKETDLIDHDRINKFACNIHKDNLKQWVGKNE